LAVFVALGQAELGVRVLPLGRLAEPADRFRQVLGPQFTALADLAVHEVGVRVAGLRGPAEPLSREFPVDGRAEAHQVVHGAFEHRLGVAGLGALHRIGEERRLLGRGGFLLGRVGGGRDDRGEHEQQEPRTREHVII